MYIDFSYDFLTLPVIPHVVVIRNLNKIMFSDLFQKVCSVYHLHQAERK